MAGEYRWHLVPEYVDCLRTALIRDMGGCCTRCGSRTRLELHHPHGRDWKTRTVSRIQRISLYRRDWESGNLILLCKPCHDAETYGADDTF